MKAEPSGRVVVEGPKGKLEWTLARRGSACEAKDERVTLSRIVRRPPGESTARDEPRPHQQYGAGVSEGFAKDLEIQGAGFRAAVKGSHSRPQRRHAAIHVLHPIPAGIKVTVAENTKIHVEGIDRHLVGQFAADVRAYYPPEPYKGKGIRYAGEHVRRKAGKSVQ